MLHIRSMTCADVPFGMRLKDQAGWNQLDTDWIRFLELQPDGCFVAELDARPVGTTTVCVFGSIAWVAMVLVDAAVRGRGVGTALMQHALAFLDQRQIETVRLDATPLGLPIYQRLGFATDYTLARFAGVTSATAPSPTVVPMTQEHLEQVVDLDRAVTSTDRSRLLERLFAEYPGEARVVEREGRVAGYLMARPGARAWQMGPCSADQHAGPLLLADALHRRAGQPVFCDIPLGHGPGSDSASKMGLTVHRQLTRMTRGKPIVEDAQRLWCSSGPEMG